MIELRDIEATRAKIADVVRRTPIVTSRTFSERAGGTVVLKAENLQRTGSFKIRGALAKLMALGEEGCARGVVAGSAGNHAQALAYAARILDVPCEVFMPTDAPAAKADAATSLGASVRVGFETVDECICSRARLRRGDRDDLHPSLRRRGRDRRSGEPRARAARGRARPGEGDRARSAAAAWRAASRSR